MAIEEYWIDPELGDFSEPPDLDSPTKMKVVPKSAYDEAVGAIESAVKTMNDPDGDWVEVLIDLEGFLGMNSTRNVHLSTKQNDCSTFRNGWQPIETAPKDGTQFLAMNRNGVRMLVHWYGKDDGWWVRDSTMPAENLTRWCLIPPNMSESFNEDQHQISGCVQCSCEPCRCNYLFNKTKEEK